MENIKLYDEPLYTSSFDLKVIKLTVLFFVLCSLLFIVGIFKLNSMSTSLPFSQSRDYIVFEKNSQIRPGCKATDTCVEILKVYRSGKVIGLGSKMFVDVLDSKQLNNLLATIDKTEILNGNCSKDADINNTYDYTIKLGVQVKRANSSVCKKELDQIESQIFQ